MSDTTETQAATDPKEPAGGEVATGMSLWRAILAVFIEHRGAMVGVGIVVFMVLFSFVGPMVYPTDQVHTDLANSNLPPSADHLLGTNEVGYDQLGRLMLGGQTSLEVGFAAAIIATGIGTLWGAIAGFS
ncbi:MAG: ABC transporter permease, partial [Nocardioidaceae bacterium]